MRATIRLNRDLKLRLRESKLLKRAYKLASELRKSGVPDDQIRVKIVEDLKPISLTEAKRLEKGRAFDDESYSMKKLIRWVFNRMHMKNLEPADAPSSGAFCMWKWATENANNTKEFYTTFLPKLIPARGADADEETNRGGIAHVEAFIQKFQCPKTEN